MERMISNQQLMEKLLFKCGFQVSRSRSTLRYLNLFPQTSSGSQVGRLRLWMTGGGDWRLFRTDPSA